VASQVRFSIHAPSATQVSLVGDFDHWDPSALPMQRARDGETWTLDVHLRRGVMSLRTRWTAISRPIRSAPRAVEDDFGVPSSVVVVVASGGTR
jgi:1,4-alpha-glucan branching enzyme